MTRLRLGVNIDHVATVRNARGGAYPDPLRAAKLSEEAGADGITAHLREDRRHISDADIDGLMEVLTVPLNFEMAATPEMQAIALRHKPHAVCIVPEKREEMVDVVWHIQAESIDKIDELFDDVDFFNNAEYVETLPSKWGFEVIDYYPEKRKVKEIKNA